MVETASEELRSRGLRAPRLPVPPRRPRRRTRAPVLAAAAAASALLEGGGTGKRLDAGRAALAACVEALGALADGEVPVPAALDAAALGPAAPSS